MSADPGAGRTVLVAGEIADLLDDYARDERAYCQEDLTAYGRDAALVKLRDQERQESRALVLDAVAALTAELERVKADSARLDWIGREHAALNVVRVLKTEWSVHVAAEPPRELIWRSSLREAIDAAMRFPRAASVSRGVTPTEEERA